MGSSQHLYVGPYIRAAKEIVDKEVEYLGCPKCRKEIHSGGFCSKCGGPKGKFTRTERGPKINQTDIYEDVDESLMRPVSGIEFNKKFDFFLPDDDGIDIDFSSNSYLAISPDIIKERIEAFKKKYERHLAWINARYPEFYVEWGLVVSYG